MDVRKWEDLPVDCLVDIFARVGFKSLIDWVPYVCKSWHKATLSPQCWKSLILPADLSLPTDFREPDFLKSFVKFVIRRSHETVNVVVFPISEFLTEEVIIFIAEGCPSLKLLGLSYCDYNCRLMLPNMICKWKDLETLRIIASSVLENVISQISIHCTKFVSLYAMDVRIRRTAASAIATLLPNIEFLSLKFSIIGKSDLVIILKGCKKLVDLDVSFCSGFEVDDEIMNLAAHLVTFKFEGVYDDPDVYCYPLISNWIILAIPIYLAVKGYELVDLIHRM